MWPSQTRGADKAQTWVSSADEETKSLNVEVNEIKPVTLLQMCYVVRTYSSFGPIQDIHEKLQFGRVVC